jgi:crotonobetainyl-CoA:carnitine CoA-transferase CaiB-like acyl-CoA transferase
MGGLRHITGEPDGPPMRVGISLGDELAGLYAVIGTLAALLGRARDGRGEHVDVALTESCFSLLQGALPEYVHAGVVPTRAGNRYLRAAPSGVYPTRDGGWLAIGGNGQAIFRRLCEAMGRPGLADDPKFATNQARVSNSRELDERIAAWTGGLDVAEAFAKLVDAHVPVGPTMSIAEIAADPQFAAPGAVATVLDDDGARIATYAPVPRLSEHPAALGRAAGRLGRDQKEVLLELADAELSPMGASAERARGGTGAVR